MAEAFRRVQVIGGPPWCRGKAGFLDDTTNVVYFDPACPEPTKFTEFKAAYPKSLLTLQTIRSAAKSTSKAKGDVTDAFKT